MGRWILVCSVPLLWVTAAVILWPGPFDMFLELGSGNRRIDGTHASNEHRQQERDPNGPKSTHGH